MKNFILFTMSVFLSVSAGCSQSDNSGNQDATIAPGGISYAPVPNSILTPNRIDTRLGTLEFFDGYPSEETVSLVYDNLDFQRGVRAFLDALPIASLHAMRQGITDAGAGEFGIAIFEDLMDSKTLFLTPNTESIYATAWLDLSNGPVVVESPPNTLGFVDDFFFNYVADLGNVGPDRGQGGKYLFLPPDYDGDVPDGFFTFQSGTYGNWLLWRGFQVDGDPAPATQNIKANARIYRLSDIDNPPEQQFVDVSGKYFNTIHANDFSFYEKVAEVIQEQPVDAVDPELLGLLASIGIEKGKPFSPDARMHALLTDAAAVGNATARATIFASRNPDTRIFDNSAWMTGFVGGSHEFQVDGVRLLDPRTLFFYYATGITPAMSLEMIGVGSQYAGATVDSNGARMDGGRTYRLRLPPEVPAKDFWSLVLYDNQTRSMLQTDQRFPSLNSQRGVAVNDDGSTDVFFGPEAPPGRESNWVQTIPGKGWTVVLRLYGPLEPWFEKTWQPGEIELMEDIPGVAPSGNAPTMATEIPAGLITPDRVETRIGTLEFIDGFPTEDTVALVYDNLDFMRGVEAFLTTMPAASIYAMRQGQIELGAGPQNAVMMSEGLMDSHSLYLTANTESVYIGTFLDLTDGPVVVESPPNTLGMVNDMFFRYVADLGNAGPDRGEGGNYLFLPPGYEGETPDGYFTYESPTYSNLLFWRGFLVDGDPSQAVNSAKETIRIYPLDSPDKREQISFIDSTGVTHNTIHANNIEFYEEIQEIINDEPAEAFSAELLGLLAAIGIEKGQPFAPDERMQQILEEAAAVGTATARAISFRSRDPRAYIYEDSAWFNPFVGGSYEFLTESGARDLDSRVTFHFPYTAVTPAMAIEMVGVGSQYAAAATDSDGRYLDGSKTYSVTLPSGIPANDFWSFVVYDPQTRSMLQTPATSYPSVSSQSGDIQSNADGSTTIWFGPQAPEGRESNWVQTVPGKGWFTILRLYGPLEPWFDRSWRVGEFEQTSD